MKLEDFSPEVQAAIAVFRKRVSQSLLRDELKKQKQGIFTDTEDCWITDYFRGVLFIEGLKREEVEKATAFALLNSFWIKF